MKCKICNKDYKSNAGLGHHIKSSHNMSTQEYYDTYIKETNKNCPICNKPNKFINFIVGYTVGCCTEHTNLIKYDVTNVYASKHAKNKIKQTKEERYGDPNYNNHAKSIKTINDRYNVQVTNISQVPEIKNKIYKSNINKLSVPMPFMSSEIQLKIEDTKMERYNNAHYTNRDKFYNTMKQNGFISKYEHAFEKLLIKHNIKFINQYKEERYPFRCDFYLSDFDIFIEINIYPAHGPHPYKEDNIEDHKILNEWLTKANDGKIIYLDWINRWTIIDVNKRNYAKSNDLHYYELYNFEEINDFIKNILNLPDENIKNYL